MGGMSGMLGFFRGKSTDLRETIGFLSYQFLFPSSGRYLLVSAETKLTFELLGNSGILTSCSFRPGLRSENNSRFLCNSGPCWHSLGLLAPLGSE